MSGYGRGWREDKAAGLVQRTRQMMREPAGHCSYLVCGALYFLILALITIFH